ncbi:hypothetical protein FJZ53_06835, partial [Candidatus Woesearchaeota archaeon]|nr:hypothetical protein [Candidatus Woesearchaeota archaeon]
MKAEIIASLLEKGYLVSPEFLENLEDSFNAEEFIQKIQTSTDNKCNLILDKNSRKIVSHGIMQEERRSCEALQGLDLLQTNVEIINDYVEDDKKREIQDFVKYFKHRYSYLREVLQGRAELSGPVSINRLSSKNKGEKMALIGIVVDKRTTKNGNITVTLEDPTGTINILARKDKEEVYNAAKNLVLDEVIGVNGSFGDNILFANNILFPDIPLTKELKKSKDDVYAVFISDIHVGSRMFLPEDFQKFLDWINCEYGTDEQKEIAKKVKYLFIVGDLVDGIGIYPEQDKELNIKDINEQYKKCAEYLSQIRQDIKVIISPGNHDALRISEPQPKISNKFAEPLHKLKNITLVTNPAMINIHASKEFPGFDVLLYHGYSFDYYVSNVDAI